MLKIFILLIIFCKSIQAQDRYNGYQSSTDSTGQYTFLWRISRMAVEPKEHIAIDIMIFRASAFWNGELPKISDSMNISNAAVSVQYLRPTDEFNEPKGYANTLYKAYSLYKNYVYVPKVILPSNIDEIFIFFSATIDANDSDVRNMQAAILNGAEPSGLQPIIEIDDIPQIIIKSYTWARKSLNDVYIRQKPLPTPNAEKESNEYIDVIRNLPRGNSSRIAPIFDGVLDFYTISYPQAALTCYKMPKFTVNQENLISNSVGSSKLADLQIHSSPFDAGTSEFEKPHITFAVWKASNNSKYTFDWVDIELQLQVIHRKNVSIDLDELSTTMESLSINKFNTLSLNDTLDTNKLNTKREGYKKLAQHNLRKFSTTVFDDKNVLNPNELLRALSSELHSNMNKKKGQDSDNDSDKNQKEVYTDISFNGLVNKFLHGTYPEFTVSKSTKKDIKEEDHSIPCRIQNVINDILKKSDQHIMYPLQFGVSTGGSGSGADEHDPRRGEGVDDVSDTGGANDGSSTPFFDDKLSEFIDTMGNSNDTSSNNHNNTEGTTTDKIDDNKPNSTNTGSGADINTSSPRSDFNPATRVYLSQVHKPITKISPVQFDKTTDTARYILVRDTSNPLLYYFNLNLYGIRNSTQESDDTEAMLALVYRYDIGNIDSEDSYTTPWYYTMLSIPLARFTRPSSEIPQSLLYPAINPNLIGTGSMTGNTNTPNIINNAVPIRPNTTMPHNPTIHSTPAIPSVPTHRGTIQPNSTDAESHSRSRTSSGRQKAYPIFPTTIDYPTIGWNTTWFLLQHNPSSAYLQRTDVVPAELEPRALKSSLSTLEMIRTHPHRERFFIQQAIPSMVLELTAYMLSVSVDIYVNEVHHGKYSMKYLPPDDPDNPTHAIDNVRYTTFSADTNSTNANGGDSSDDDDDDDDDKKTDEEWDALEVRSRAYVRPFIGERFVSPVLLLHPNDLLAYSFTYSVIVRPEFIPTWANPKDEVFQKITVVTNLIPFPGIQSYYQAVLPLAALAPDPAELRTAPSFKYSVKQRTAIPADRATLSFIVGRMTAQEGSILSLPTVDSGACRITPDGLPLLSRHNIWMKREYMPVSVSPISAQAADVASAGKFKLAFLGLLPESLRGSYRNEDIIGGDVTTPLSAIQTFVLSTLPVIVEDWWYFDGLVNSTSTLSITAFDRAASGPPVGIIPFPDPDPGLQMRASPDQEVMIFMFTWRPSHTPHLAYRTTQLIFSPDSYTTTGRAMGFMQALPLKQKLQLLNDLLSHALYVMRLLARY